MRLAQAQVLIPAVTQQPEGPWTHDSSKQKKVEQHQPVELDFNSYYDQNIKRSVAEIVAEYDGKIPVGKTLFWAMLAIVIAGGFWIGSVGWSRITHIVTGIKNEPVLLQMLFPLVSAALFMLFKYKRLFIRGKNKRSAQSEQLGAIIIPEIFNYLDNGCSFNRTPFLNAVDLNFLGIESAQFRYFCHDEVAGKHNGIGFKMMELEIEQEVKSNKSNSSYYKTVFNGVYLLVDVPKSFTGRVDIKRDSEKYLSAVNNVFSDMKRVRLEDPEFEKVFQVYSNNQVEARYLLSTTMMQSLNNLRFLLGGKSLEGSFYNGKLALRIDCPYDLFEIEGGLQEEEYRDEAKKMVDDLNSIFKAIDAMDLNTQRIV